MKVDWYAIKQRNQTKPNKPDHFTNWGKVRTFIISNQYLMVRMIGDELILIFWLLNQGCQPEKSVLLLSRYTFYGWNFGQKEYFCYTLVPLTLLILTETPVLWSPFVNYFEYANGCDRPIKALFSDARTIFTLFACDFLRELFLLQTV